MEQSSYPLYRHGYIDNPGYYESLSQYCQPDPNMHTSNYKFTLPDYIKRKYTKKETKKETKKQSPPKLSPPKQETKETYTNPQKVWGPDAWNFLHRCSFSYSNNPTPAQQRAARRFFKSLPEMLPCDICTEHCKKKIKTMPPQVKNKYTLSKWLVDLHNEVNKSLNKPIYSYQDAKKKYDTQNFCKV